MDIEELNNNLLHVYELFLNDGLSEDVKDLSINLYDTYKDLSHLLSESQSLALNSLVDLAYGTGVSLSKEKAKYIFDSLN